MNSVPQALSTTINQCVRINKYYIFQCRCLTGMKRLIKLYIQILYLSSNSCTCLQINCTYKLIEDGYNCKLLCHKRQSL